MLLRGRASLLVCLVSLYRGIEALLSCLAALRQDEAILRLNLGHLHEGRATSPRYLDMSIRGGDMLRPGCAALLLGGQILRRALPNLRRDLATLR